jgi:polysaccharide biosynthesis/export protein
LPTYVIEPPDILVVEALQLVPKAPYRLRTGDAVLVTARGVDPSAPINGQYLLGLGGILDMGPAYGSIAVAGMTADEARAAVTQYLSKDWKEPKVTISLVQIAGLQQIAGDHLVGPDGMIALGSYGSVPVVGLTLAQARQAVESHLSQFLERPEVSVDMFAYNSKVYYVITEGAGLGDHVVRFPITGNETVLDALANINGTTSASSKRIWISRPTPYADQVQILPVDWYAITKQGSTVTNYQIMPGDRLFIAENELVALDTGLGKLIAPIERVFGFSILGVRTLGTFTGSVLQNNGGFGGGGIQ